MKKMLDSQKLLVEKLESLSKFFKNEREMRELALSKFDEDPDPVKSLELMVNHQRDQCAVFFDEFVKEIKTNQARSKAQKNITTKKDDEDGGGLENNYPTPSPDFF